MSIVFVL